MILVRNVFRLECGKSREAVALWQHGVEVLRRAGVSRDIRILTDLAGPFNTIVVEESFESLGAMEDRLRSDSRVPGWREFYPQFAALVKSGHRELFTIVDAAPPS